MRHAIDLPTSAVRALIPKLGPAISEVEALRRKQVAARAAVSEARGALRQAEERDRQARAEHVRGKRKQAPKLTFPEAQAKLSEAEATAAVIEQATADTERDLIAAVEEHRGEYAGPVAAERDRRRETMAETARKLAEADRDRRQVAALSRWLRDPKRFTPGASGITLREPRKPSGEGYRLEELVSAIEAGLASLGEAEEREREGATA